MKNVCVYVCVCVFIIIQLKILKTIFRSGVPIVGAQAIVLGRSKIVGTPVAELLKWHHATVTVCHSKTKNLPDVVSNQI